MLIIFINNFFCSSFNYQTPSKAAKKYFFHDWIRIKVINYFTLKIFSINSFIQPHEKDQIIMELNKFSTAK